MLDFIGDGLFLRSIGKRRRGFNPASLFAGGTVRGVWFDPSDRTTLYQDAAGTTPASLPGDPVGLMLDKSKGLVLGPELVGNGGFDDASGWGLGTGWTISAGLASWSAATGASLTRLLDAPMVAGRFYQVIVDFNYVSGAGALLGFNGGGGIDNGPSLNSPGQKKFVVLATLARTGISITGIGGSVLSIDNISVRELPGYHASQSVAASRPTLARHPKGGRRNLLVQTENFADAAWTKSNVTATLSGTGSLLYPLTSGTLRQVYSPLFPIVSGASYTEFVSVKAAGFRWIYLMFTGGVAGITTGAFFDLQAGVVGQSGAGLAPSIASEGDGWYKIGLTIAADATRRFTLGLADGDGDFTATVSGTNGVLTRKAQLELGTTATPYQRVTTAYDVTEAGVEDLWYLAFDGVDDFMVTPAIDLTATDKVGVFAGVRRDRLATTEMVVELSTNTATNNGSFYFAFQSVNRANFYMRGASNADVYKPEAVAPEAAIWTSLFNVSAASGAEVVGRKNGNSGGWVPAGDAGSGNFGSYPLYIGRRGGTSLPFTGNLYGLIVAGKMPTAAEIARTEAYLNGKTGAYAA